MNNRYILIKESDLDSRIEEYQKTIKSMKENNLLTHDYYRTQGMEAELQSLKQKGEVVEVEKLNETTKHWLNYKKSLDFFDFLKELKYKLIKKV